MACMEHECNGCRAVWHDNKLRPACPECGSTSVFSTFDEADDRDYDVADYDLERGD
jgi:predicted  nucleic acid-binding Zn-ribbon protein